MMHTQRLVLRDWRPEDLLPFIEINKDPKVMEFFPGPLSDTQTIGLVSRIRTHFDTHGYGRCRKTRHAASVLARKILIYTRSKMKPSFQIALVTYEEYAPDTI